MSHIVFTIHCAQEDREVLLAFLSQLPFDSFMETPEGWEAYLAKDAGPEAVMPALHELQNQFPFTFEKKEVPAQNWNTIWEAGFQPIRVGDFCGIRADFHEALPDVSYELVISPRMAFGTGHHETTYLMIQRMEDLPLADARVLDYGCGTGILAILAARLGAARVDAVDIEEEAYENTLHNASINGVVLDEVICGTLEDVPGADYDVILANINRNVILDSLPSLYHKLVPGGVLLVSGILHQDEPIVVNTAEKAGFEKGLTSRKGEWMTVIFRK